MSLKKTFHHPMFFSYTLPSSRHFSTLLKQQNAGVDFKRLLFLLVNSFHVRPNRSAVLIQQLRAIVASNGPQLGSHSSLDQAQDTNLLSTLMTLSSNKTEHHTQGSEGQRIDTEAAAENAETRLLKVLHDLLDSSKT
jgi:hypothetical protein